MKKLMVVLVFLAGCANPTESLPLASASTSADPAAESIPAGDSFSFQLEGYPDRFWGHFMFGVVNDDITLTLTGRSGSAARALTLTGQLLVERDGTRVQRSADGGLHAGLSYLSDEPDQNRRGVGTLTVATVEGERRTVRGVSVMRYDLGIDAHGVVALSATVRDHSFRGGEDPVGPDLQLTGAGRGSFGCSVITPGDAVNHVAGVEMPDPMFRSNPRCRELLSGW